MSEYSETGIPAAPDPTDELLAAATGRVEDFRTQTSGYLDKKQLEAVGVVLQSFAELHRNAVQGPSMRDTFREAARLDPDNLRSVDVPTVHGYAMSFSGVPDNVVDQQVSAALDALEREDHEHLKTAEIAITALEGFLKEQALPPAPKGNDATLAYMAARDFVAGAEAKGKTPIEAFRDLLNWDDGEMSGLAASKWGMSMAKSLGVPGDIYEALMTEAAYSSNNAAGHCLRQISRLREATTMYRTWSFTRWEATRQGR